MQDAIASEFLVTEWYGIEFIQRKSRVFKANL